MLAGPPRHMASRAGPGGVAVSAEEWLPAVGGPYHGELRRTYGTRVGGVVMVPHKPSPFVPFPYSDSDAWARASGPMGRYTVLRVMGMLPGRTDRQVFSVLSYGTRYPPTWRPDDIRSATTSAWALGWSPPDEGSELWLDAQSDTRWRVPE